MNFKTTLFLLVLLIIVGGGFWLIERKAGPDFDDTAAPDTGTGTALFTADNFVTAAVTAISIEADDQTIELARSGADWHQTAPVQFPLQTWSTQQFGDDAAKLRHVEKFKPAGKDTPALADIGLSPPKAVVTFHFDDAGTTTTQTIKIGQRLPLGGRGFVMVNDDQHVYVVNDDLHKHVLEEKINDLRKKGLEAPDPGQADRVTLRRGDLTIDMIKADAKWALSAPHSGRVDSEAVKTLLNDVGGIYIRDFIADQPESLSMYGLDQPQTTVTVHEPPPPTDSETDDETDSEKPAAATIRILRIGSAVDLSNEQYFATWARYDIADPVVFTISKSSAEKFDKSVDDMRDPAITPIPREDIRQVSIDRGESGAFTLLYSDGAWSFADPKPNYRADPTESRKLVEAITDARADDYTDSPQIYEPPGALVTLTAIGRAEPDIIKVCTTETVGQYTVVRNNETTGYLVPADDLKRLFEPMRSLRNRQVLDLPATTLSELTIKRPDGVTYAFIRPFNDAQPAPQPGPWQLTGHERFEKNALDDLIGNLLPLQATGWMGSETKPGDTLSVKLKTNQGDHAEISLDVNRRIARCVGQSAETSLDAKGFQISNALIEKLDAEFRYRTVIELTSDDITKVTVTKADGATVVTKNADGNYAVDGDQPIDQSRAAGLYDTLAGLRVKRFKDAPPDATDAVKSLTIVIEVKDREPITLTIDTAGSLGHLPSSQWFELDPDVISKLNVDLTADSEEESATKTF